MNDRFQFSLGQLFGSTAFFAVMVFALSHFGDCDPSSRLSWSLICIGSALSGVGMLTSRNPAAFAIVGVYIGMFGLILGTIFSKGLLE
ncbi:MAG TPA: hypothetical protein VG826_29415 [Pirellulales bacterium]|nr:hypothetical protein [Pirellulales bacterium]